MLSVCNILKDYLASDVFHYCYYFSMLLLLLGLSYVVYIGIIRFEKSRCFFSLLFLPGQL